MADKASESRQFEVLAALHGEVGLTLGDSHFLEDVRVLDVIGHGVGQRVVVLRTSLRLTQVALCVLV
jgi:hypothetical protein